MRKPIAVLALTATALLVATTAFAGSAAAVPPPDGQPGWVACTPSGSRLTYQPTAYLLSCADANSGLRKLDWSSWNGRRADARGVYYWNDCTPSCAAGKTYSSPADIELKRVRTQHGAKVYTRVVINFVDSTGKPAVLNEKTLSWSG